MILKFPEKILYEDIPVTMPLHFYANSVSIINQVCLFVESASMEQISLLHKIEKS